MSCAPCPMPGVLHNKKKVRCIFLLLRNLGFMCVWGGRALASRQPSSCLPYLSRCPGPRRLCRPCPSRWWLSNPLLVVMPPLREALARLMLSYSRAHAQNGVAKHKQRHILETSHALIISVDLAPHFWEEVASTTVFLVNRQPSYALKGSTPSQRLFGSPSSYSHLCYFGYVCS